VLATMCAVAWVAHALIPCLPWEVVFVLGAILSTDPLAAATIMRRLDTRAVPGQQHRGRGR
jgi:monovalent cation/hydrogen antiporter